MSDCPTCDNVGWTDEYAEAFDADGIDRGQWYRLPCRNWRHSIRPTLEEIAAHLKAGKPLADIPTTHSIKENLT